MALSKTALWSAAAGAACLAVAASLVFSGARNRHASGPAAAGVSPSPPVPSDLAALKAREGLAAETVWGRERLAERHGAVFEELWDALNAASNKLALAAAVPVRALVPPRFGPPRDLGHGILQFDPAGAGPEWDASAWRQFVQTNEANGWDLVQVEFRHNRFEVDSAGRPERSRVAFTAHLANDRSEERTILEGDLVVAWETATPTGLPGVRSVDASGLTARTRKGEPGFRQVWLAQVEPPDQTRIIDPLIAYDLDGDGVSEYLLPGSNLAFRRTADGRHTAEPLCRDPAELVSAAVVADFDGDGSADLLCAGRDGLVLFRGSGRGTFEEPGRPAWNAGGRMPFAQVLTCGDVDGDGDLDVWLGQYKAPYERGQMPTPYYDANDGYPAFLLLNDGHGAFTDATAAAGLERKRWRRCYSASLADCDGDGDLDLVVVSDFAGLDLYANDGHGHFTDATSRWVAESHGFGMAHAWADFNRDGVSDLLMIGMNSPTADRLDHLGLERPGFEAPVGMRSTMTRGNRLYLGRAAGAGFGSMESPGALERTGWSWGCSAFDFDNDGYPDVYVANGHVSGRTVSDREPEFWLHDIYVAGSRDNPVSAAYLEEKFNQARKEGRSFGGYEKNRLLWNRRGKTFCEIGFLMGGALEADSRNVVADDFDQDGRMDLVVTTLEAWPIERQTVRLYRNVLPDAGNWIGIRLREQGPAGSPVGATVTLRQDGAVTVRQVVTGDSYRAQQAATVHFGLGAGTRVDSVQVRWMNGRTAELRNPAINRYHLVSAAD